MPPDRQARRRFRGQRRISPAATARRPNSRCRRRHRARVVGADLGELDQLREGRRLHQIARARPAVVGDQDVLVDIGERLAAVRHERLARHGEHGFEQRQAGHVGRAHLAVDHLDALFGEIGGHISMARTMRAPRAPQLRSRRSIPPGRNARSGGLARNRTGVQGFAVLCVTTPPRGLAASGVWGVPIGCGPNAVKRQGADPGCFPGMFQACRMVRSIYAVSRSRPEGRAIVATS